MSLWKFYPLIKKTLKVNNKYFGAYYKYAYVETYISRLYINMWKSFSICEDTVRFLFSLCVYLYIVYTLFLALFSFSLLLRSFGGKGKGQGAKSIARWSKSYTRRAEDIAQWWSAAYTGRALGLTHSTTQETQNIGMKRMLSHGDTFWNHMCFGWRQVIWKDNCNTEGMLFFLNFISSLLYVYVFFFFLQVFVHHLHDIPMVVRRALDTKQLEWQDVVSHRVDAGIKTQGLWKIIKCFNCWTFSSALLFSYFLKPLVSTSHWKPSYQKHQDRRVT